VVGATAHGGEGLLLLLLLCGLTGSTAHASRIRGMLLLHYNELARLADGEVMASLLLAAARETR
jgi:hypothetical protein